MNKPALSAEDFKALAGIFQGVYSEMKGINEKLRKVGESVNLAYTGLNSDVISKLTEITELLMQKKETEFIPKTRFDRFRHWLKSYTGIDLSPSCLFICLETIFIFLLIAINSYILIEKGTYKDNDLKYRYILMKGEATGERLDDLQSTFDRQRNYHKIKLIRDSVCDFEYRCEKRAEAIEQSRLLEQQAEQLKQNAERLMTK